MSAKDEWPPISPYKTGLRGLCPRCGQGHLFNGFLALRKECEVCGLDYSFADPADGPAFFVMCFACVPSVIFALWLEVVYSAPLWVHLVTTLPLMLLTGLAMSLGAIFNGAIIVEFVFSYPGLGRLLISAVYAGDYGLVLGVTTISIVAVSAAVFLIDILYPVFDPRVKLA